MSRLTRFLNLWRRRALDAEFDEELRFHYDMRVDANVRAGMSRAQAEAEARRHLGSTLRAKEGMREARAMLWLETFARDLAHGARLLWRQPMSASLAILTLSLGIGANTVIFSLVQALLLRPLPFPDADRLVAINDHFRADGPALTSPTVPEILDLRARSRTLESISFYDMRDVQISGGSEPARAFAARVEGSFLATLGVQPALGRTFAPDENDPGRDRVVIFTDGFWRRNFGANPDVVGRTIVVNGAPHEVIGVMPASFHFDYLSGEPLELFVPFTMSEAYTKRGAPFVDVRRVFAIGRLATSAALSDAIAEAEAISAGIARDNAYLYRRGSDGRERGFVMRVEPLRSAVAAGRQVLLLLSAAVGLILLIACVNTAQFLFARAIERKQEVAVRSALGAGRLRLARQFLTESLLFAAIASVFALIEAGWLLQVLSGPLATRARIAGGIGIEPIVVLFTGGIALATTVIFGLLPSLHFARAQPLGRFDLRAGGAVRARSRQLMIAFQVASSVVLLVLAGVLVRALIDLQRSPSGYSTENVTAMRMRASPRGLGGGPTGPLYRQYLERISGVPGVQAVAVADAPIAGTAGVEFAVVGGPDDGATLSQQRANWRIISPRYFDLLGIPLLEGRAFEDSDVTGRPPVAIINEDMARRFWPGQSPLGQQVRSGEGPRAAVMTIVGVVGNVRPVLQMSIGPQMYVSYLQQSEPNVTLMIRSQPGAAVPIEAVKQALWSVVPEQPVFDIRPLEAMTAQWLAQPRLIAQLLGGFAALAFLMSTLGVYMIVTYLTTQRTKEVAVRRAIGATSRDIVRLLTGQTARWTIAGVVVGIGGAIAATSTLDAVLTGIARPEATTVAAIGALYLIVVIAAVCIPAARALRLDPSVVLRTE